MGWLRAWLARGVYRLRVAVVTFAVLGLAAIGTAAAVWAGENVPEWIVTGLLVAAALLGWGQVSCLLAERRRARSDSAGPGGGGI